MKRKALLVLLIIILLTGCTAVRIKTESIDTILEVLLTKDNNLYNRVGRGYKYYVPRGVNYIDTDETNDKLYSKGNYYYLYVDIVSYYQDIKTSYKENNNAYYSRKLSKEEGFKSDGYLEITEENGLYHVEFMYNYAKIESIVSKDDLDDTVLNSIYILSTIQFNREVIELMIDDEKLNNREEKYEVFKNQKDEESSELQVYGQ